jgi:hypothetical protein
VAKRGKNVDIEGLFFDFEEKPLISGPIVGGKDMQSLHVLLARRILSLWAIVWDSTPFGKENAEPTGNGMGLYSLW